MENRERIKETRRRLGGEGKLNRVSERNKNGGKSETATAIRKEKREETRRDGKEKVRES